jgi:methyl-accepting chemotaxis protein
MANRMTEASKGMIVAAQNANEGSDQAKTVSANAAVDVSSVATASEQLLVSIEEITQQVAQSTVAVKNSVERTVETNAGMNRLAAAAQKVGDVVSLISRIAAQTNLLALNATIEAARAGEAGRGFAVVAQEVKTLATQTAKATQDITGQIAEIQEATVTSVHAIEKIQGKISEVEHISNLIAAAVQEQGAATEAIARNVRSAASGSAAISGHVEKVARSVGETSANASSVADLARELDEIAKVMTDKVTAFTHGLRAA